MFTSLTRLFPVHAPCGPGLIARFNAARALDRSRRALGMLDASRLDDLGLTNREAQAEAARKPWDAPANWTC
ncbi:DUF1127 domain-containing protein [Sulfitobacter sp. JB4-11]|uniref:DUF1127 domain-containing protein n=1 Tax=Sulfitobacter rhodophyticola TaxID=3238304 RepID=UPI00351976A3